VSVLKHTVRCRSFLARETSCRACTQQRAVRTARGHPLPPPPLGHGHRLRSPRRGGGDCCRSRPV